MRTMSALVTCWCGVFGLAFMTGCGPTTYRMPDVGEQDATALLEIKHGAVSTFRVDGRPPHPPLTAKKFLTYGLGGHLVRATRIRTVEILPGNHELELVIRIPTGFDSALVSTEPFVVQFEAQAGRTYRVNGSLTVRIDEGDMVMIVPADGSYHSMGHFKAKQVRWSGLVEDITGPSPRVISKPFNSKNADLTMSEPTPPGAVSTGGGR